MAKDLMIARWGRVRVLTSSPRLHQAFLRWYYREAFATVSDEMAAVRKEDGFWTFADDDEFTVCCHERASLYAARTPHILWTHWRSMTHVAHLYGVHPTELKRYVEAQRQHAAWRADSARRRAAEEASHAHA